MIVPIYDDNFNVIGTYDDETGAKTGQATDELWQLQYTSSNQTTSVPVTDTGFGIDKPSVINWAGYAPPSDPIAAGLNPANLVKTSAGGVWKYVQTRSPTGTVSYTPMPVTGAGATGGISPVMWAAIAGLAILALT